MSRFDIRSVNQRHRGHGESTSKQHWLSSLSFPSLYPIHSPSQADRFRSTIHAQGQNNIYYYPIRCLLQLHLLWQYGYSKDLNRVMSVWFRKTHFRTISIQRNATYKNQQLKYNQINLQLFKRTTSLLTQSDKSENTRLSIYFSYIIKHVIERIIYF